MTVVFFMRCRGRRGQINWGAIIAAFGLGLVVYFCCSNSILIAILAVVIIILGIVISK